MTGVEEGGSELGAIIRMQRHKHQSPFGIEKLECAKANGLYGFL